jgi:hypothetical protein
MNASLQFGVCFLVSCAAVWLQDGHRQLHECFSFMTQTHSVEHCVVFAAVWLQDEQGGPGSRH